MIIAKEKKKNNIAEYILYMWQVEDLIRANQFDIDLIQENVISRFPQPKAIQLEIRGWYQSLIEMMKNEKIEKQGHFLFIKNTLSELNEFHQRYLDASNPKYKELYDLASPNIQEFQLKLSSPQVNEIEVCFNGLYALLMLRLQQKEITKETTEAMSTFSNMLAYLSIKFKQYENGALEL